jgi:hypothetical protein
MNAGHIDADAMLIDLVTFKWLMVGCGWRVNLSRLNEDTQYRRYWAERGIESGQRPLAELSETLLARLPQPGTQAN